MYTASTKSKPKVFLTITLKVVNKVPSNSANSISDKCLTMWHKNYPLRLMYVCTLPCEVMRVKIVSKRSVMSRYCQQKSRGLRRKQFSLCSKHIVCLHCYYERSKRSPPALTDAVRWWRHCWTPHAWWCGLPSPHNNKSWMLCILHRQC